MTRITLSLEGEAFMRKLVIGTFLTLDGVMQAPGGPEEDGSGGFEYGGWLAPLFDDVMGKVMGEWINRADGILLGRKTYEIFAAYWPGIGADDPTARKLNTTRKYVATRTLEKADWQPATILNGNVVEEIKRIKEGQGGELQVHGSGDLIQTLLKHELVDEIRLWIAPIVLGIGKRLFARGTVPARFELFETKPSTTGVVLHVLRARGKPEVGSFAKPEPKAQEVARRSAAHAVE